MSSIASIHNTVRGLLTFSEIEYYYLLVLTIAGAVATLIVFLRKFKLESESHSITEAQILAPKKYTELDLSLEEDRWRFEAILDLERNTWNKWNALAGSLIAIILFWYSVFSLLYTELQNGKETESARIERIIVRCDANTKAFFARWHDVLTPHNRQCLDRMIKRCDVGKLHSDKVKLSSELAIYIKQVQDNPLDEQYIEYATLLSILNLFEQIASSYNEGSCIKQQVRNQYSESITYYFESIRPFVVAYRQKDLVNKGISGYIKPEDEPWYEVEKAISAWSSSD